MKKMTALVVCLVWLFALAACSKDGKTDTTETTASVFATEETVGTTTTEAATQETTSEAITETTTVPVETTTAAPVETTAAPVETTTAPVETTTAPVETTTAPTQLTYPVIIPDKELIKGIQPVDINLFDPDPSKWTTQQIIDYYKFGMAMEDHDDVMTAQAFELIGKLEGKAAILNNPVKLAMKLAAQPYNSLTGGYWAIQPSDLKSADAHREGDYIVINLYPLEQTDGPDGDEHEGTVGHVVNVVQGIDDFIGYVEKNFSLLNAKYDDDSVVLKYTKAYAKNVKINTKTGKMESGNWGYTLDVYLDHCSMVGINFENFHTTIGWKCWYPAG